MRIHIEADYPSLCAAVARRVKVQLDRKLDSVLVFPTGNTPLGLFKVLTAEHLAGRVDFSQAYVVILDEYAGLEPGDARSLTGWLSRELLDPVGIAPERRHGFDRGVGAMEERILMLGGLDLVVLGLGPNGHLGFNEPGSAFDSRTRRVELAPQSIASNAAYWGSPDRVPREGYTLGMGTIAEARDIVLMVSGASKRAILRRAQKEVPNTLNPASFLQLLPNVTVFADAAATAT